MRNPLETTYTIDAKADPLDKIVVEVGDSKQVDFYPQVKVMRWDNEVNASFRLITDVAQEPETKADGAISTENIDFYSIDPCEEYPEGAYEFEVILKERPASNVVQFTVQDKGIEYFYQPELTAEEIAEGGFRPENVAGSYAVYASESKTNIEGGTKYKCGKLGHIYRPRIEDAKGDWVWGELLIENGILSVTIPDKWLDSAVYPVRHAAGLTFGYTSIGASNDSGNNDVWVAFSQIMGANSGTVSMLTGAFYTASAHNVKMAIYNQTNPAIVGAYNTNPPTSLIANSSTGAISVLRTTKPTQSSHWTSSGALSAAVTANYYYFISFTTDYALLYLPYDSLGGSWACYKTSEAYANYPPSTAPACNPTSSKYSIYATYTEGEPNAYTIDLADGIGVSPALGNIAGWKSSLADSAGVSPTLVNVAGFKSALSDTFATSEGINLLAGRKVALGDSFATSEDMTWQIGRAIFLGDGFATSEGIGLIAGYKTALSDAFQTLETIGIKAGYKGIFADGIGAADSLPFSPSEYQDALDDILGVAGSVDLKAHHLIAPSDSFAVAEALVSLTGSRFTLAEAVQVADALTFIVGYKTSINDGIGASAGLADNASYNESLADLISIADDLLLEDESALSISLADILQIVDSMTFTATYLQGYTGGIGITESMSPIAGYKDALADGLQASESLNALANYKDILNDGIHASEAISGRADYRTSINDAVDVDASLVIRALTVFKKWWITRLLQRRSLQ